MNSRDAELKLHLAIDTYLKGELDFDAIKNLFSENKALCTAEDNRKLTPLIRAILYGNLEFTEFLLSQQPVLGSLQKLFEAEHYFRIFNGYTPLHFAAFKGDTRIIEALINAGASLTASNLQGDRALHIAVQKGHVEAVAKILQHTQRKDVDLTNNEGRTAQELACQSFSMMNLFVNKKAEPKKVEKKSNPVNFIIFMTLMAPLIAVPFVLVVCAAIIFKLISTIKQHTLFYCQPSLNRDNLQSDPAHAYSARS